MFTAGDMSLHTHHREMYFKEERKKAKEETDSYSVTNCITLSLATYAKIHCPHLVQCHFRIYVHGLEGSYEYTY